MVGVWAPLASRTVEVVRGDGRRTLLAATERGYWAGDVPDLGPGGDYGFSLDGGPARPDPRSPFQPDGVDGLSRVVDHGAFPWTDGGWGGMDLPRSVLYELHVGTFSPEGTFDGVAARLDHLVDLGIDAIELMPVAAFAGARGWGYDTVHAGAPHAAYGGPDGLRRLVDACHARGVGVILDVVYNHLGPAGNHVGEFGPYFVDAHPTNWGPGLNTDGPGSDEVRAWVVDNARMWLRDYHLDGLRLDAVHAIVDESATHVLEQLSIAVADLAGEVARPLWLIAESDLNAPRFVRTPDAGGYGLHASWADEWHHALHAVLTGERDGYYEDFGPLDLLAKALRQAWVYDGTYSPHRQRTHGRPPTGLDGGRFVVSTQNHDQVGNRARGERLGHLVSADRVRIAAALLLTSPFVPLLFQGEEWSASSPFQFFTDHDPELGRLVSEGRRREFAAFGWLAGEVPDPQSPATFDRSVLRWDEVGEPGHAEVLAWYKELIALRRSVPALAGTPPDDVAVAVDEATDRLVVRRRDAALAVEVDLASGDVVVRR
ncbi:MAG TPA: malto-oligosyltrehalose trehalohydrolase [Acidimicrobiales bacterium]|nr:malto-oligosyltrehalose trehalohydrolase [Acidimicrobiales bacterium]